MTRRMPELVIVVALVLAAAATAQSSLVADVRAAINRGDLAAAERLVATARKNDPNAPEALEALSWLGRGALGAGDRERADKYARETERLVVAALKTRSLDADKHLPIALGAAIETEAKVMVENGQRASAVRLLQEGVDRYRATSIRGRLQKNIHLLSLEGQPAPALHATEFLGAPMPDTKGRPVLLFFWAHWCPDCKAEAPIIADLQRAFRSQGLIVIGPTRRYGYVANGADAAPAAELSYIEQIRQQYYGAIDMAVPVSNEDALAWGMDATPTLVLIDRQGKVAVYHPGRMTREELESAIRSVVAS